MRFYGAVGYADSTEGPPGVWKDVITEKNYFGDVIRASRHLAGPVQLPPEVNANLTLENQFSILADAEAYKNFMKIRYIEWEGNRWRVTNVEVRRPRLILTIGDLWDGNTA